MRDKVLSDFARGTLRLLGQASPTRPRDWIARHVARIPEDRTAEGVVGDLTVWENAILERHREAGFSRDL